MKRYLLLTALAVSGPATADPGAADPFTGGSAEAGAAKAGVCVACHGAGGNSTNPEWPKLGGQHSRYTYEQLKVLKSGERSTPVMNAQAAGLSDQDMKDLAAYYAGQKLQPGVASPDALEVADPLYNAGDAKRGIPACASCHGPRGLGNAAAGYPRIGGQHAKYTANVLRIFQSMVGAPVPEAAPVNIMIDVSTKLSDSEIEALASYINGLQ